MADRTVIPGTWRYDGARPFLHRAVVLITGQGDELATPFAECTGGCHQGDLPCDCELANATPLDPTTDFPTPDRTAEDDAYRARAWRWILLVDVAALGAFALLVYVAARHS